MSLQILRSVNFGSRKGSLSTVGFAVYNADGSVNQARTTTGVAELITDIGIYCATVTFDNAFQGTLLWDTGEGTPLYAAETIDYRTFSEGGGTVVMGGGGSVQQTEDIKLLLKRTKRILNVVNKLKDKKFPDVTETVVKLEKIQKAHGDLLEYIKEATKVNMISDKDLAKALKAIPNMREEFESIYEAMTVLLEYKEFENIVKGVDDVKVDSIETESK